MYAPAQPGQGTAYCDGTFQKMLDAFSTCCSEADKQTFEYKFGVGLFAGALSTCGPRIEASIGKSRLEHDAGAAQSCYAAWSTIFAAGCGGGSLGVSPSLDSAEVRAQLAVCNLVFRGLVAENGACSMDADCADGLTCVGWTSDAEGSCKKPPAIDEPCGKGATDASAVSLDINHRFGDHPECAPGGYCNSRKCAAQRNSGESCSDDEQCAGGKRCRVGVCGDVDDAELGGACKENDDCKTGLYCNAATFGQVGTCAAKLGDGAPCTAVNSPCKGRCDRPDSSTNGTCRAFCGSE